MPVCPQSAHRLVLATSSDDLKAKRDRAILLLGFAAAMRRSEIAALDVADLEFSKRGLLVTVRRSKTDQTGEGQEIGIPFVPNAGLCAATAVRTWLDVAGITEGAVFRSFRLNRTMTPRRMNPGDIATLIKTVTAPSIRAEFGSCGWARPESSAVLSEAYTMREDGRSPVES